MGKAAMTSSRTEITMERASNWINKINARAVMRIGIERK